MMLLALVVVGFVIFGLGDSLPAQLPEENSTGKETLEETEFEEAAVRENGCPRPTDDDCSVNDSSKNCAPDTCYGSNCTNSKIEKPTQSSQVPSVPTEESGLTRETHSMKIEQRGRGINKGKKKKKFCDKCASDGDCHETKCKNCPCHTCAKCAKGCCDGPECVNCPCYKPCKKCEEAGCCDFQECRDCSCYDRCKYCTDDNCDSVFCNSCLCNKCVTCSPVDCSIDCQYCPCHENFCSNCERNECKDALCIEHCDKCFCEECAKAGCVKKGCLERCRTDCHCEYCRLTDCDYDPECFGCQECTHS